MSDLKFITTYNPELANIHNIIQKNLSTLSPSLFPAKPKESKSCVKSRKTCDISKNYLITDNKFKCKVTGRFYNVRGNLSSYSSYIIYLISYKNCEDQYIESAIDFKTRFRIHKSDIKTKKDRSGTARLGSFKLN